MQAAMAEAIVVVSDGADQTALVSLFQTSSHFLCTTKTTPVVTIGMVQRALEGVGIHIWQSSGMTLWAPLAC